MKRYDIAFIGHMCFDEIIGLDGKPSIAPGSAVLCGAMAAVKAGAKVIVYTKMSPQDDYILDDLRKEGVETRIIPSAETSHMRVEHLNGSVDNRRMTLIHNAGYIKLCDLPGIEAGWVHLAGISDQEFSPDLIYGIKEKFGCKLSADMQSFVRQVSPVTREVNFADVADKKKIISQMDMIKLDNVEAWWLTKEKDLEKAALILEDFGCNEIVITSADGVLARAGGKTYFEKFNSRSLIGRTGRGDTTFAAYLASRLNNGCEYALRFAAALVSIKMESPGPFSVNCIMCIGFNHGTWMFIGMDTCQIKYPVEKVSLPGDCYTLYVAIAVQCTSMADNI